MAQNKTISKYEIIKQKQRSLKGCFLVENIKLNKKEGYPETNKHLITPEVFKPDYQGFLNQGYKIVIGGCLK